MKVLIVIYIFPYLNKINKLKLDFILNNNKVYNEFKNKEMFNLTIFKKYNYYYYLKKWKNCGHLDCKYWNILIQIKTGLLLLLLP